MSVVNYIVEQVSPESVTVTWPNLANGDTGLPMSIPGYRVQLAYLSGIQGIGGQVTTQVSVSVDNPEWLDQSIGNTVPGLMGTEFVPGLIRPNITVGDGSTNLTVSYVLLPTHAEL